MGDFCAWAIQLELHNTGPSWKATENKKTEERCLYFSCPGLGTAQHWGKYIIVNSEVLAITLGLLKFCVKRDSTGYFDFIKAFI